MDKLKTVMQNKVSRRKFITGVSAGVGAAAAVSFAAGCSDNSSSMTTAAPTTTPAATAITDVDILNFALNLEYLEAEFYLRAVTGNGLAAADIGTSPGAVTGGAMVNFQTAAIKEYAVEIAGHEQLHVQKLRAAITAAGGTPADRPAIDFTNAFNTAAVAGKIGTAFNPFDNETDFVLGAFTFEDVGVTAYNGAAGLFSAAAKTNGTLAAAGGIVAVEAYHAGLIRTLLVYLDAQTPSANVLATANLISDLRGTASSVATGGVAAETHVSATTVVACNSNSLAYNRTTDEVLHIVYLNPAAGAVAKGGFYPNGMNGKIVASAS